MNKTLVVLFAGLIILWSSCQRGASLPQNDLSTTYPFDTLMKYGWYYFENYDTAYVINSYDTIPAGTWPTVRYTKVNPVTSDACTLTTYYYFNADYSFTSVSCNGQHNILGTWSVVYDTSANSNFVTLTATNGSIYTPLSDTVAAGATKELRGLSLVDPSTIAVTDISQKFWGNNSGANFIVNYDSTGLVHRVFKHN